MVPASIHRRGFFMAGASKVGARGFLSMGLSEQIGAFMCGE